MSAAPSAAPSDAQSSLPDAYRKLALLFGCYPEFAVAKRFRVAQIDNLNILQAELANVETDLTDAIVACKIPAQQDGIPIDAWVRKLQTCADGADSPWGLTIRRRKLLKQYGSALLTYRSIDRLPRVNPKNLDALERWYHDPRGGAEFRHGVEDKVWKNVIDLAALSRDEDAVDGPLLQAREWIISLVHWMLKGRRERDSLPLRELTVTPETLQTPLSWYPESKITAVVDTMSTVFASVLPALSIFALVFIESLLVRVGIILILTLVFSITMALLAKARRAEVWAVSAAFSAVLVVFVGGTNSSMGNGTQQCVT